MINEEEEQEHYEGFGVSPLQEKDFNLKILVSADLSSSSGPNNAFLRFISVIAISTAPIRTHVSE